MYSSTTPVSCRPIRPPAEPNLAEHDWQLGTNWRMLESGINVKRYPMCYATHRAIDAMLDLVGEHDLAPQSVAAINVRIGDAQKLMLRNHDPATALEGKFSMEFALAAALTARRVSLKELDDAFVRRADVRAVMRKVHTSTTEERMAELPFAPDDRVSVVLANGETLEHAPVVHPKGSWQQPLSEDELREKFLDCAGRGLPPGQAERLFERLAAFERLETLRELPLVAA